MFCNSRVFDRTEADPLALDVVARECGSPDPENDDRDPEEGVEQASRRCAPPIRSPFLRSSSSSFARNDSSESAMQASISTHVAEDRDAPCPSS